EVSTRSVRSVCALNLCVFPAAESEGFVIRAEDRDGDAVQAGELRGHPEQGVLVVLITRRERVLVEQHRADLLPLRRDLGDPAGEVGQVLRDRRTKDGHVFWGYLKGKRFPRSRTAA